MLTSPSNLSINRQRIFLNQDSNNNPDTPSIAVSPASTLFHNHLDQNMRYQSIAIKDDISKDIAKLNNRCCPDGRGKMIQQQLGELRKFIDKANKSPYSMAELFKFHHKKANYTELIKQKKTLEQQNDLRELFIEGKWQWAHPMLMEWSITSLTTWQTLVDSLEFEESSINFFMISLMNYLSCYQKNKGISNFDQLTLIPYSKTVQPSEVKKFLNQLEHDLNTSSSIIYTKSLHEELKSLRDILEKGNCIRIKHSEKINKIINMYQAKLENKEITSGKETILKLSKPILVLSDVLDQVKKNPKISEFHFEATNIIYLDCNLDNDFFHGKNICIIAPQIEVIANSNSVIKIDVSGLNNTTVPAEYKDVKASPGQDGTEGEHGQPGESGGNVHIECFKLIGKEYLQVISNSGDGSNGGSGGDGGDGVDGEDGKAGYSERNDMGEPIACESQITYGYKLYISYGTSGNPGGKGGNGGGAGKGGVPGEPGIVTIIEYDPNSAKEFNIVRNKGNEGKESSHRGKGGKGGKPGKDGIDRGIAYSWSLGPDDWVYEDEEKYAGKLGLEKANGGFPVVDNKRIYVKDDESAFSSNQQQRQNREQENNKGKDGDVSKKTRSEAVKKNSIDVQGLRHNSSEALRSQIQQNKLFVTSTIQAFYQNIATGVNQSSDVHDADFIQELNKLKHEIAEVSASIDKNAQLKQEEQTQNQTERTVDLDVEVQNIGPSLLLNEELSENEEGYGEQDEQEAFYEIRQYLIFMLCELKHSDNKEKVPTELITEIVKKFEDYYKNEPFFVEELSNVKHWVNLTIDFIKNNPITDLEQIIRGNSLITAWAAPMSFNLLKNIIIDKYNQEVKTINNTLGKLLEKVISAEKIENCLVCYALAKYLDGVKAHELDTWEHINKIINLLGEVNNLKPVYYQLLKIPVAKWHLALETLIVKEKLSAKYDSQEDIEDEAENKKIIEETIIYLDKIESQFGSSNKKKVENIVLNLSINTINLTNIPAIDKLKKFNQILKGFTDEIYPLNSESLKIFQAEDHLDWYKKLKDDFPLPKPESRKLATLIDLVKQNPKNGDISKVDFDKLTRTIQRIQATTTFNSYTKEQIKEYVIKYKQDMQACLAKPYADILNDSVSYAKFCSTISLINRAIELVEGYMPRETQLIAVLLSLESNSGSLLELPTGEGKTIITLMLALLKALTDEHVDIVTSSSVLAKRDAEDENHKEIFTDLFGFSVGHNCHDTPEKLKACYKNHIVYGETGTFERDILRDLFYGENVRGERHFDSVIVDEVDSMVLDKGDHMLYLSQVIPGTEHLEVLYVNIWLAVASPNLTGKKEDIEKIKRFIEEQEAAGDISYPEYYRDFVRNRLEIWIESAFIAKNSLGSDDEYKVGKSDKNIITMDKNTGVQMKNSHLSEGVHQFLQLKHLQRFKPETLKSIFMSNTTFFKKYKKLSGLSGTMGSESEKSLINSTYGVSIAHIPTFKPRQYTQENSIIADTEKAFYDTIKQQVENKKRSGRPCLIINESTAAAKKLYQELAQRNIKCFLYTDDDESLREEIQAHDIVISTNLAGRGTDLKISDSIERRGGLHVIMTYCPPNLRIERQAFGRAARKGQKGSGQFILLNHSQSKNFNVDQLIFDRNQDEKLRLEQLQAFRLKQIALEEELLKSFKERVLDKIRESEPFFKDIYYKYALEQFAFWLDQQKNGVLSYKVEGQQKPIRDSLDKFIDNFNVRDLKNSTYNLLIAKWYLREKKDYAQAISYFDKVIDAEPEFSELAEYYKAAAVINNGNGYEAAIKCMRRAEVKVNQRIKALANLPEVIAKIKNCIQSQGKGSETDFYSQYIEDKMTIYNTLLSYIYNACGNREFDLTSITSGNLSDEQKEKIREKLKDNEQIFIRKGIVKELEFNKAKLSKKLKLAEHSEDLKTEIIDKVLAKGHSIEASEFENMLGNVDDLFRLLCDKKIIEVEKQSSPDNFSNLVQTSIINALKNKEVRVGDSLIYANRELEIVNVLKDKNEFTAYDALKAKEIKFVYKEDNVFTQIEDKLEHFTAQSYASIIHKSNVLDMPGRLVTITTDDKLEFKGKIQGCNYENGYFELSALNEEGEKKVQHLKFSFNYTNLQINHCEIDNITLKRLNPQIRISKIDEAKLASVPAGDLKARIMCTFGDLVFKKKYPHVEEVKNWFLEQAELEPQEQKIFKKSDITLLSKKNTAEKLISALSVQGILHEPYLKGISGSVSAINVFGSSDKERDKKIEARIREIVPVIKAALESISETDNAKVLADIVDVFKNAIKNLEGEICKKFQLEASDGEVQASLKPLAELLQDNFTYSLCDELTTLKLSGLDAVVIIENKPYWWSALIVVLLGVVQIIIGAALTAMGLVNFGAAFISEGVGDIMFAIQAMISGNFSWSAYLEHKIVSLATSILTMGVGAVLSRGVQVTKAGVNTVVSKVLKKTLEAVVISLSNTGTDAIINAAFEEVIQASNGKVKEFIEKEGLNGLKAKLVEFYQKTKDNFVVSNAMKKVEQRYLNLQAISSKISQYFQQVLNAIAAGIGNAAKISQKHGAAFQSLQATAKAIQTGIKIGSILENIAKALTEVIKFVSQAEALIKDELINSKQSDKKVDTSNTKFIDEEIKKWSKLLEENMVSYIRDGIAKPNIQNAVNGLLRKAGHSIKEGVIASYPGFNILKDAKYERNLLKAREHNLTKLTSKDSHFANKKFKSPEQVMSEHIHLQAVETATLHPNEKCANTDGHTVGSIAQLMKVGVMFFRTPDGRLICLPPHTFSAEHGLTAVEHINEHLPVRYRHTDNNSKLEGEGVDKHRVAVMDNGEIIDIPALNGNKKYCDEQVRLFNDKLKRIKLKYPNETPEQHKQRALVYAQKEHKVIKMRSLMLLEANKMLRNDPILQKKVAACHNLVGAKNNSPKLLKELFSDKFIQDHISQQSSNAALKKAAANRISRNANLNQSTFVDISSANLEQVKNDLTNAQECLAIINLVVNKCNELQTKIHEYNQSNGDNRIPELTVGLNPARINFQSTATFNIVNLESVANPQKHNKNSKVTAREKRRTICFGLRDDKIHHYDGANMGNNRLDNISRGLDQQLSRLESKNELKAHAISIRKEIAKINRFDNAYQN